MGLRTYFNTAAAGLIGVEDPFLAEDDTAGREIRSLDMFHQIRQGGIRILQKNAECRDDLMRIVRRDVGRHTDGDTR